MKKRTIALLLAMALVFGVAVGGTVAWMTSQSGPVVNTFTIGLLSITLDEADVDDSDKDGDITDRDMANSYMLLPGGTYDKDPTVHVQPGSADCWVFVTVANGIEAIEDETTIENQMLAKGWVKLEGETVNGAQVWHYNGSKADAGIVKTSDTVTDLVVFETFSIKADVDRDTLDGYKTASITIQAYAIQADEELTNAQAAWDASGWGN